MVALLTNIISPHQIPLAREIAKIVGKGNFLYVYTEPFHSDRLEMGWTDKDCEGWCVQYKEGLCVLEGADTVYCSNRDVSLLERRAQRNKVTTYMSERWFKPPIGILRLLHPRYFLMAWRIVRLIRNSASFTYLPIGIHAARDMARLCGLMHGDLRCLFRAPKLDFERKPGGRIYIREQGIGNREQDKKYCLDKMRMWGYFVEPSQLTHSPTPNSSTQKVLWVGRLLDWKRVDTIIKAVGELSKQRSIILDVYGIGPEEKRLKMLAAKYGETIKFHPPVPIDEIRCLMRNHDVYVLSSNAYEGWGAVVSEALEEGMKVIGTYEAGSSATILPKECLFRAGDWRGLLRLLQNGVPRIGIGDWSAVFAAKVVGAFDR